MGVTLRSKNKSVDFTYSGFMRLRRKIAELQGGDVAVHYAKLFDEGPVFANERKTFFDSYNAETERIAKAHGGKLNWLLDFLYQPDAEGRITVHQARKLLRLVGDYDDGLGYGYARPDVIGNTAYFADFVAILRDCDETKKQAEWY